jgi:hypothetical protein
MQIRYGAKLIGIVYVVIGIIGFIPLEILNPFHPEGVGATYLLRHIAVNWLHNVIHLTIGLSGLWASQTIKMTRLWGKVFGVTLLLIFGLGMVQATLLNFPMDQMLLGLVPLNSPGHMLHLVTGSIALYLGLAPASEPDSEKEVKSAGPEEK